MNNNEKLTRKSQEALQQASAIASEYNHQQVDIEHLLSALLKDSEGPSYFNTQKIRGFNFTNNISFKII